MSPQQLQFATAGLDFFFGLGGKTMGFDRQWLGQGSVAQYLDPLVLTTEKSFSSEQLGRYFASRWESFQLAQINHCDFNSKRIVEPAFGKTSLERHLAAFKSGACSSSRPGALALVASTGGLSMTGTISPAHALAFFVGTLCWS
jgi:hypothetical protein